MKPKICVFFSFLKAARSFDYDVPSYFVESRGGADCSKEKSIPIAFIRKCVGYEGGRGIAFLTLCMFGIQCACVLGWTVGCTCAMFHVLLSRVCVYFRMVKISMMLYICYCRGAISLTVCAASIFFNCTRFYLLPSTSSIILLLCGVS